MREIVLGNQQLLIAMDKFLQVRDIYFPHVGQYNHLIGHAQKIGILENNNISWLNDKDWKRKLLYKNETLVTNSSAVNETRGFEVQLNENVYCEANIFFRKIAIKNTQNHTRNVRIIFNHDFYLYGDGIGDTALYHPERQAVIHYKRSTYFLIGLVHSKPCLDAYDIGEEVSHDLKGNSIAQGKVKSAVGVDLELPPNKKITFTYYMIAGKDFDEVFALQDDFIRNGVDAHLEHAQMCQQGWVDAQTTDLTKVSKTIRESYKRSLLIIKTQFDKDGAIIAANDSDNMLFNKDTYSYMWPRDGALVAMALIDAGFATMTKSFFRFCAKALYKEGCLLHKYNPDGTLGSSWHSWELNGNLDLPIQEDETALVLVALEKYYQATKDKQLVEELFDSFIRPAGEFMSRYRSEDGLPKASHDLWEERRGVFTFTTAAVVAGLKATDTLSHLMNDKELCETCTTCMNAVKKVMVEKLYTGEYFRRGIVDGQNDDALDASVYGIWAFDIFAVDDPMVESTMNKYREWLAVSNGGFARYAGDYYHRAVDNEPGNPWFICSLWYAQYLIRKGEKKEALKILEWICKHSQESGVLPEQIHPHTNQPLGVSPLTWSHAEFVRTVTELCR